jgi:hypothetical protein
MCIPRVFKNITRERVMGVIKDLDLGVIERIDMVQRENEKGDKFQRVFVHFKKWNSNPNAERARQMLLSGKEIKIIYDDPWFWKISANKSVHAGSSADHIQRKPVIRFDDSPRAQRREVPKAKRELKVAFTPRSPSSSPPRSESAAPSVIDPLEVHVDYGNLSALPLKRRIVKKPVAVAETAISLEIKEDGEASP